MVNIPFFDNFITILGYKLSFETIALLGSLILILFIINYVISKILKRRIRKLGVPPDFYNILKFSMKIVIIIIIFYAGVRIFDLPSDIVLIISGLFATAVAFASMKAIVNFISGLWIMVAHPFNIGDYIAMEGREGTVLEITLNYTKIKNKDRNIAFIPNVSCLKSEIINFTINTDWLEKYLSISEKNLSIIQKELSLNESDSIRIIENRILYKIMNSHNRIQKMKYLKKEKKNGHIHPNNIQEIKRKDSNKRTPIEFSNKFIRYCFSMGLKKEPYRNAEILNGVCSKWEKTFGFKPEWFIIGLTNAIEYRFIIITQDPEVLARNYDLFIEEIYERIFS